MTTRSNNGGDSPGDDVRVLVVDDHPENVLALEAILGRDGYLIETASSGAEALRKVLHHEFAVILLDVVMPIMDGFETAQIIRSREASRHVPLVFLTAKGSDLNSIYKGYSVGAVDYLIKPLDGDIVRAKVAVFAELFRKTRQIRRQEEALRAAERHRSEEALRDSETLFEATFDDAAVGIAHTTLDGRWLRVNRRLCEILGVTREHLRDRSLADAVHTDGRSHLQTQLARLGAGDAASHRTEVRLLDSSDSEIWCGLTVSLLRDRNQTPRMLIVVVQDISERKRAEQRQAVLAAASELLLSTLEPAGTLERMMRVLVPGFARWCVISLRTPHKVVATHVERDGETDLGALADRLFADPAPGDRAPDELPPPGPPILLPAISPGSLARLDPNDAARTLLAAAPCRSALIVPITLRQQPLGRIIMGSDWPHQAFDALDLGTAEDLAHLIAFALENARLYREAQEAIGARDEFLSIASHELRTPLTPLQMHFEMLTKQSSEDLASQPDRLKKIVDRSQRQVRRLEVLIENLLDVSRAAAGRLQLELETVELCELVRDVASRFAEELDAAGSALTMETTASLIGQWDRLRLEQVVTNLVGNAIKYGAGQPIEITVDGTPEQARLCVRDHGIGIDPAKIDRLFDRFERAVSARSYGGLGLGLYIARQIVQGHNGVIHVESAPGEGSRFTVELPRQPAPDQATV